MVIGRWIGNWADRKQQAEFSDYLRLLENMDDDEVGLVVALATHQRHRIMEEFGWDLLYPAVVWLKEPGATLRLVNLSLTYKKMNEPQNAGAMMIWAHTMRAMAPQASPELRSLGRRLWLELSRGFPHVPAQTAFLIQMMRKIVLTDGYDRFPDGLAPSGRSIVLRHDDH